MLGGGVPSGIGEPNKVKLPAPLLVIVAFAAVELPWNCVEVPSPTLLIVAFPAVDVTLKIVCPVVSTPIKLLIVAFPPLELPEKSKLSELLIVAFPAVEF